MEHAADIEDIDAAWLSSVLDTEVRAVQVERIGTGQVAAAYRLTLDADGVPATLVAKVGGGDDEARGRVAPGYRNEVGFYAELLAGLDVRAPRCWHAAISDDALRFTLLLEDLAPRVPGVQEDGCTLEQGEAAIRNLAGLHAPRWNDAALHELDFLQAPNAETAAFLGDVVKSAVDIFVERYSADLNADDVSTLRASAEVMAVWPLTRPEPFSVIHGDYRLDNLMFGAEPSDVVAVDWQTLAIGPPARDVAYFLGTSVTTEERRQHEKRLLATYHHELKQRGVRDYSAAQCYDDYRLGQLQGPYITTLGAAYATRERSEHADRMFVAMAQRSCAAIRDLRTLDLL